MPPLLSIVVPAYNEESAVRGGKLAQITTWMRIQSFETELVVVNDQSSDQTAALAEAALADIPGAQVITIPHAGKAAAVIAGIRKAQGQFILFSDMDQATPISEANKLLAALQGTGGTCDIAAGSRGVVRKDAPPGRYLLSWGQVVLKAVLLGLRITDTQCGFKAFECHAALDIIDHLVVYAPERLGTLQGPSVTSGFDVEFLFVAQRLGYCVREVPVQWSYQQSRRVNLVRDAHRGLLDLFKIAAARWSGKY
jgi:glycosyltransferase involved in cell wall biosynthesis